MKFMEETLELQTDTLFHFICSFLTILVFAPVRLTVEISKKVVFLPRKCIDQILFTASTIGLLFTLITSIAKFVTGQFSLLMGTFPIILVLVGDIILLFLYFGFNAIKFVVYSNLEESEFKKEFEKEAATFNRSEQATENSENNKNMMGQLPYQRRDEKEADFLLEEEAEKNTQSKNFQQLKSKPVSIYCDAADEFTAPINEEVYESDEVKAYQQRVGNAIDKWEECESVTSTFSKEDIKLLTEKVQTLNDPYRFIPQMYASRFNENLQKNDEYTSEEELCEVPEDFILCS